jgi:hypothetical protein
MRLGMGSSFIVSRALLRLPRTLSEMKRCEEKIRYRTAAGARWALWNIWWDRYVRGRRRRRERRVYACPRCAGWHLTSQPKRRG